MKQFLFLFCILLALPSLAQKIERIPLNSEAFGAEREILIYTPRLYEESPAKKYEVVYVFDSQARQYFDIVHSNLTFLNYAVPIIVVGVVSQERDEDFLPPYNQETTAKMLRSKQPNANRFLQHLEKEVIPYVDANYRTLPTKLAVGHSNGGVFITYSLLEHPKLFDAYIAISPHLRYDELQMIDRMKEFDPQTLPKEVFYYMAKGNESGKGWKESIAQAKALFESKAYQENIHFEYGYFPNLDHTTVIPTAIINGFNAWFNYQYWNVNNLKAYNTYLQNAADYQFSEQDIAGFAYHRYWAKDYRAMNSLVIWGLELYPDSKALASLSERAKNLPEPKESLSFPEKCLGVWEGTMYMYKYNTIRDSVPVRFTVARTELDSVYTWKTEYLSPTRPAVKDYKLVVDQGTGRYILDEGNDVKLIDTHIGKKLFSVFLVDDILLTSSYEFTGDTLVFEVTSGKPEKGSSQEGKSILEANQEMVLKNYIFSNLQRVELRRVE